MLERLYPRASLCVSVNVYICVFVNVCVSECVYVLVCVYMLACGSFSVYVCVSVC